MSQPKRFFNGETVEECLDQAEQALEALPVRSSEAMKNNYWWCIRDDLEKYILG
jgi:hypothetical protein